jgi:PAS domain S-box-containing protein
MSLNRKLQLILVALTAAIIMVILACLLFIVMPAFRRVENQNTTQTTARGIIDLNDYVEALDSLNLSLAISNEAYSFVLAPQANQGFIPDDISDDFFETQKLNGVFIINNSEESVFEKTYGLDSLQQTALLDSLVPLLAEGQPMHLNNAGDRLAGILIVLQTPLLVSVRPILPGNEINPAGSIVMIRKLDESIVSGISNNMGLPVSFTPAGDTAPPSDIKDALHFFANASNSPVVYSRAIDLHTIAGYGLIQDMYGDPALVLKVVMLRDIYGEAVSAVHYFMFGIFILIVLNVAGGFLMIRRLVISRVAETADFARHVRTTGDLSQRLPVAGTDELSALKTSLNSMLDTLSRTQQELRTRQQNEEKLRFTIESVTDAIITTDLDWNIVQVNDAALFLADSNNKQELIGRNALDFVVPSECALIQEAMRLTLEQGHSGMREINMHKNNGNIFMAEVSAAILKNAMGAPAGFVISARDVTERKNAEIRLRAQYDIIERILATLPHPVLVVSEKGTLILANQSFYYTFAIHELDVNGMLLNHILPVKELDNIVSGALAGDKISLNVEFRMHISGKERTLSATAISMPPQEILLLFIDLTEVRERSERLYLNDRMASIGELAAGIAHELGTPLSSIIMFSELLAQRDLPKDVQDDVQTIKSEAQRGAEIVRNLLTFARKNNSFKRKCAVPNLIDVVLKLRAYEHRVKNIKVIKKFEAGLPEITVDFSQMEQVFLNIIVNAEQSMYATHKGGTLTINAVKKEDFVSISFADDGAGIPEANIAHVFDPFFTTKQVGEGTGLGLSICYGIVTQHGGRLIVSSAINSGATFTVELPVDHTPDIQ